MRPNNIFTYQLLLFIILNISCKAQVSIKVQENEYYFQKGILKDYKIFEYENQLNEDLVLWFDFENNPNDNIFFEKTKGDYKLTDMIYEKILKSQNMVIGQSFIKKLSPHDKFRFHIYSDSNEQLTNSKIDKYIKIITLKNLLSKYKFEQSSFPSFSGNDIIIEF